MTASLVSSSGLLGSSPALCVAKCTHSIDQRCSSNRGGPVYFDGRAPLGRRAAVSSSSRSSRAAAVVFATKQKRRSAGFDMDIVDDDDDDNKDDEVTEFADMEEWMNNRPPGFGLKDYDTSLEDRLLAEIEADKKAQLALASKKKIKKPLEPTVNQDAAPQGVEVYVGNLPRKRNVDRDLRAAFRSVQGLLHIRPVVDGNEKTREPTCKGLAFLTFASDNEAKDFIRRYNSEDVKFGKTEKKVVCELAAGTSRFKKGVSQKQGTDSPRLQVRDATPSSPSPGTSPSSDIAVELGDKKNVSAVASNLSDRPSIPGSDIDSLELSEDELLAVGQEIWAELEDEDDFELDRELEADDEEVDVSVSLNIENVRNLDAQNDEAEDREDLEPSDTHVPDTTDEGEGVNDLIIDDEVKKIDSHKADSTRGRGFGSTSSVMPDASVDKDKRIEELESKLKALQGQLEKRLTKAKVREDTAKSEEKIESLERRLLARANMPEKDSKTITAKKITGPRKSSSKVKGVSKGKPSRPKLGSASRLKNKEKKLYTGILGKYSSVAKEMAM